jgi:hypothetical protein
LTGQATKNPGNLFLEEKSTALPKNREFFARRYLSWSADIHHKYVPTNPTNPVRSTITKLAWGRACLPYA